MNQNLKSYSALIYTLVFLFSFNLVSAQDNEIEMEILSFEEMMNSIVVTASKEEQKKSDAPAIIDVVTELQIKDMNASNLYEIISLLPGVEMQETYFGRTVLNFRSILAAHYNNKVLLLINGNPLYEWVNGSFFLESIPVSSILRIEVIRGPGSSLYGTNAYAGVINVITKTGKSDSETTIGFSYGSDNTVQAEFNTGGKIGDEATYFLAGSYENTTGYEFNITADEKGRSKILDYYSKPTNIYGNVGYKNLFIDFGYLDWNKSMYGLTPNIDYTGNAVTKNYFINSKFTHPFSDDVQATFYLRYSNYKNPESNIGYFPVKGFPGHEVSTVYLESGSNFFSGEVQFNLRLSNKLTNVSGLAYETYNSDPYLFKWETDDAINPFSAYKEEKKSNSIAGYTQFTYKTESGFSFVGGARIIKDNDVDEVFFAPRLGVIYKVNNVYSLKALYGRAFRTPSFFERYVETNNVLFGSKDLLPEKIQTIDFGVEAEFNENLNGRLNTFYQTTSDGIVRIPTTNPAEHGANAALFTNATELEIYGAEVSLNGIIGNTTYFGINASWKDGKNTKTDSDLLSIAHITSNAWLSYRYKSLIVTPYIQFIGSRDGISGRVVNGSPVGNYTIDSYVLANLSVTYKFDSFSIKGSLKNIFDVDYSYPEYVRNLSEEVPGGPGLTFLVGVNYTF